MLTPVKKVNGNGADGGELDRLTAELRRVNQEISKIAGVGRPSDRSKQQRGAEKQGLLAQRTDLERRIRSLKR
jgi:hypothetical protein